ncbi:MAG: (Fe-S)-binding protein [Planctomycetota bacterium]|nr:(Fe-S)-binding protein [Planctomycetota bacterium]
MPVALFVPCYIDQFYPDVAVATLELLERLGLDVVFPDAQTCCGQPMANTGCVTETAPVARRMVEIFADYDAVICPSGSCTAMIRHHYAEYFTENSAQYQKVASRSFELCEYLHDVLQLTRLNVTFPHRVSLHQSCHGLRELRLGGSSESMTPRVDKVREILKLVEGIEWCTPQRSDECCGFGGTFAVNEPDISAARGRDRITDHLATGSHVITSADMSCLMHLQGLIRREDHPITVMHVAQILVGRPVIRSASHANHRSPYPNPSETIR